MLGGHEGSKSFTGGFNSLVNDIERLNSLINWHNLGNFAHRKYMAGQGAIAALSASRNWKVSAIRTNWKSIKK
jgi:hypothetical protein